MPKFKATVIDIYNGTSKKEGKPFYVVTIMVAGKVAKMFSDVPVLDTLKGKEVELSVTLTADRFLNAGLRITGIKS